MRRILQIISWLSLAGTIGPALLFYLDKIELDSMKTAMFVATIVWFVATSLWMGQDVNAEQRQPD